MLYKKIGNAFFISVLILLLTLSVSQAQEIPNNQDDQDELFIDSIDLEENLLDSNLIYKEQFDSLSKDGEWVKANKSDLLRDLNNIAEDDVDFDYPQTDEVIYVWRPYGAYANWNPYYNGNWVFTSYGWVWSSYYSWGWGPYNYGRWYNSGYYGWVWFPGVRWAPNWVTWRNCNNYAGWYPTCPRVYWKGAGNRICSNRRFVSNPKNWVFVDMRDFTKKIDNNTAVDRVNNSRLLKESVKIKTAVYTDPSGPKIKYNGPDVNVVSKESGVKIEPKNITLIRSEGNQFAEVRNNNVSSVKEDNNRTSTDRNSITKSQEQEAIKSNTNTSKDTEDKKPADVKSNSTKSDKKDKSKKYNYNPPSKNSESKNPPKEKKSGNTVKSNSGSKEKSKSNNNNNRNNSKRNNR